MMGKQNDYLIVLGRQKMVMVMIMHMWNERRDTNDHKRKISCLILLNDSASHVKGMHYCPSPSPLYIY